VRIIVCGGRDYADRANVERVLRSATFGPVTIVHGDQRCADTLAGEVAESLDWRVEPHPADWDLYRHPTRPNPAGFIRNEEMARLGADLCIAFPGGNGTADMVRRARSHGIPVRVVT